MSRLEADVMEFHETNPVNFAPIKRVHSLLYVRLKHMYRVLRHHEWNRTQAAASMVISIRTIRNNIVLMRNLGWDIPSSAGGRKEKEKRFPREQRPAGDTHNEVTRD